jgi:hypothetical protein
VEFTIQCSGIGFAIEINFRNLENFNIGGLYNAIYTFAIAVLIILFIKKMIETYLAWSSGDPDNNPLNILIGFLKAMIIMITFGFIYTKFANVFYEFFYNLLQGMTGSKDIVTVEASNLAFNVFGAILYLVIAIQLALLYFQFITRGIEMFILRLGMPFASIGLLNSDGGAFKGYIKKFMTNAFTIIVQLLLMQLAIILMNKGKFVLSLSTSSIALRTPHMLQEFMSTAGGGSVSGKISTVTRVVNTFRGGIGKGKK